MPYRLAVPIAPIHIMFRLIQGARNSQDACLFFCSSYSGTCHEGVGSTAVKLGEKGWGGKGVTYLHVLSRY